jgi:CubicO group peptidase (beta-lactamase class C family)
VVLYELDGTVVRDDLKGKRPDCPVTTLPSAPCDLAGYRLGGNGAIFSPQGGLRISAKGLAVIGRLILNDGRHRGRPFLQKTSLETMLQPAWRATTDAGETDGGFYCAYGLAVQSLPVDDPKCDDDLFGDGRRVVGHAGEAYRLRSGLWVDRRRGVGIAYFATNNGTAPPAGLSQYRAIEESLARKLED